MFPVYLGHFLQKQKEKHQEWSEGITKNKQCFSFMIDMLRMFYCIMVSFKSIDNARFLASSCVENLIIYLPVTRYKYIDDMSHLCH